MARIKLINRAFCYSLFKQNKCDSHAIKFPSVQPRLLYGFYSPLFQSTLMSIAIIFALPGIYDKVRQKEHILPSSSHLSLVALKNGLRRLIDLKLSILKNNEGSM